MSSRTFNRFLRTALIAPIASCVALTSVGVTTSVAAGGPMASSLRVIPGADRYATAGLIATGTYDHAETVILASGTSYPDALAASALAGDRKAPILLMDGDAVPAGTAEAYAELAPSRVLVVGGRDRITDSAVARLTGDTATVTRIAGVERYQTAAAVAAQLSSVGSIDGKRTAFLATDHGFADAVSAGPAAAAGNLPILLTSTSQLPGATRKALTDRGIAHVVVLGDENAVGAEVVAAVRKLGITVERLGGVDRNHTATAVADWSIARGFLDDTGVVVARGDDLGGGADALAVAPMAAVDRTPILLTANASDPSTASGNWMAAHATNTVGMTVVGNEDAVGGAAWILQERRHTDHDQCGDGCGVVQWPNGIYGAQPRNLAIDGVAQVEVGLENVLARRTDGTVWGWGNVSEETAGGLWSRSPVQVQGLSGVHDVDASQRIGLALDDDGAVWQFGWRAVTATDHAYEATVPAKVSLPARAVDVSAELDEGVAVLADGSVWTWGSDLRAKPVAGMADAVRVSSSYYQTTVLRSNGDVWAFGWDFTTGPDDALTPDRPAHDVGWRNVKQVEGSDHATYAVHLDGTLSAWGWNSLAELGHGYATPLTPDDRAEPEFLDVAALQIDTVSAGGSHVVARRTDADSPWVAWGSNYDGEVDPSSTATVVELAVPLVGAQGAVAVTAGVGTNIALVAPA